MKLRKFLMPVMAAAIIFTACNEAENNPAPIETGIPTISVDTTGKDTSVQGTIDEYFPFAQGGYYVYDRTDALGTSSTYNIYVEGNKMQRISIAGSYRVTEIFEYTDGELRINYASDAASCFENLVDIKGSYPMTILKEPLTLGNTWETYSGPTIKGVAKGMCAITDVGVEIETPQGKVSAIEVSTELENGYTNVEYYAKGIGLVKNGYFIKGFETTNTNQGVVNVTKAEDMNTDMVLNSYESGHSYEFIIKLHHPNENVDELESKEFTYIFDENTSKEKIFEELLKNSDGKENEKIISPNTTVNSIAIERALSQNIETGKSTEVATVKVDLSKNFSDDMNAGSGYEMLLLQSLENTFKEFFKAAEFVLTVDGEPYVSKH